MNFQALKLAYFSPTGTTRKVLQSIAEGIGAENVEHIDLTLPQSDDGSITAKSDELVVMGVPVYEGRVARAAIPRLERLKGDKTPAVIVVMYGNRDFEDALIELSDLSKEWGFLPIAGGAFIGEHSFASVDKPLANGRPDAEDLGKAKDFGAQIRAKIDGLEAFDDAALVEVPGNKPYIFRDRSAWEHIAASTIEETCTLCGDCVDMCPMGAITIEDDAVKTDNMACILCCACIKGCPVNAREVNNPDIAKIFGWVCKHYQERREPQSFV
ncbi:4Fe-4S ferredoxin iron-sulfur binding domain protein [Desulfatibacillum aliphaticivorans]|uniref:4Fe-4S ferredoxin iron-sulfur binding domain protein n=1 Tax=Desulfatibacillum aliphaticivorans TaxID=218208 RepID=B8FIE1_DESAL|nr:EFR1 family ferrodoxin [Desulfatibacillum aliphaticivorans]ACL03931.1 4Fe-4S ferredoxin iron-sulfur binding domain protein [Desulfatibacillum aliphaticivorans]